MPEPQRIARAFSYAGVFSILVSYWMKETRVLAESRVYELLVTGGTAGDAVLVLGLAFLAAAGGFAMVPAARYDSE